MHATLGSLGEIGCNSSAITVLGLEHQGMIGNQFTLTVDFKKSGPPGLKLLGSILLIRKVIFLHQNKTCSYLLNQNVHCN